MHKRTRKMSLSDKEIKEIKLDLIKNDLTGKILDSSGEVIVPGNYKLITQGRINSEDILDEIKIVNDNLISVPIVCLEGHKGYFYNEDGILKIRFTSYNQGFGRNFEFIINEIYRF